MEIIYITEGVNFKFDRTAYKTAEAAFADLQVDYPNSGGVRTIANTRLGGLIVDLGNGNIVAITPVRLL